MVTNRLVLFVPTNTYWSTNYLGRSSWAGDGYFQGKIGHLKIHRKVLSATEVLVSYWFTKNTF